MTSGLVRARSAQARARSAEHRIARALAALSLLLALGCRGAIERPPEPPQKSDEALTIDSFRDLISQGALRPVEAMENDAAFADPKPDTEADAFDARVRQIERELALAHKPESAHVSEAETKPPNPPENTAPPVSPENPYLEFGKRIMVYSELGLITKPYPLRVGLGVKLKKLLETFGRFPLYDPKDGPQKPTSVRIDLEEKWDQEVYNDLRAPVPNDGALTSVADWLIITTGSELLHEVESFINIFAAGVPQIEIEAKIVEVTLNEALDVGVKPIDPMTPIFGFPDHTFVRGLNYSLPNVASSTAANSLLQLGAVQDGLAFNMILQALATYENVAIISRPKIAVREGGTAQIVNTLKLPNYNVQAINAAGQVQTALTFEEVGIKLFVVPRVVGTRTVALSIDIENSAQSGNSIAFTLQNGQTVSNPIISRRSAKTVVYLEPGQAVILGGLISERNVEVENKVPLLGDIPLLGWIFRSTLRRKEQTNVLFFIRPRILQGSDLNREF